MQDPDFPAVERQESPDSARPPAVTVVAVYQFIKAVCLMLVFCWMWTAHKAAIASAAAGQDVLSRDPLLIVMPAVALYLAVLGFGLWYLQGWARWLILPAFALIAPRWMVVNIPNQSDLATLREFLPQPIALMIVTLDVIAIWVLLSPKVRKAFGDADSDLPDDI